MAVINVGKESFEKEVLEHAGLVLVDFWAAWCGPCQMLSPVIDQLAEEIENVKVCKVNVDDENELAVQYKVMTIPTLVVIKDGQEVNRSMGVVSKDAILDMLK